MRCCKLLLFLPLFHFCVVLQGDDKTIDLLENISTLRHHRLLVYLICLEVNDIRVHSVWILRRSISSWKDVYTTKRSVIYNSKWGFLFAVFSTFTCMKNYTLEYIWQIKAKRFCTFKLSFICKIKCFSFSR